MEEENRSYRESEEQGGIGRGDGVSAPKTWANLLQEIKCSTLSTVRNMKLPNYEQLSERLSDYEKKMSWLTNHMGESLKAVVAELDLEKGLGRELQEKIIRLETDMKHVVDDANESLMKEKAEIVAACESKVRALEDVVRECDAKRERVLIQELREKIDALETDLADRDHRIGELKHGFLKEKSQIVALYEGKGRECADEIEQLKAELSRRSGELEKMNVGFDAKKSEYEKLIKEKDEEAAARQKIRSLVRSQGTQIVKLEAHIYQGEGPNAIYSFYPFG